MKNSLLKNFFSSGIQAISVQVLGIVFFFVISIYLPKEQLGMINWSNAVSLFITTLLSCGLDQIVVRRIAASKSSDWAAAAYLIHALAGSVLAFLILTTLVLIFNNGVNAVYYLPWFFSVQAVTYVAMPLRQYLNARQKFTPYAFIAMLSNCIKIVLVLILVKGAYLNIHTVFMVLFFCAALEFVCLFIYIKKIGFRFSFKAKAYGKLLKESFPQYISVLFDSGNSRADWILLGMLTTNALTAEYSFAYRAFEMARLPIAVIAPVILNIFSRMLFGNNRPDAEKQAQIRQLYRLEIFAAMLFPLLLNILWSPLIDFISKGKYGTVDAPEFMMLSCCIPAMFIINLFWTLCFSAKKYKQISVITISSAIANITLNLVLIPFMGKTGAATAFVLSTLIQLVWYYRLVGKNIMSFSFIDLFVFFAIACCAYFISIKITANVTLQLLIAILIYVFVSILTRRIHKGHLNTLQLFLKK